MRKGIETDRPGFLTEFTEKFFGVGLLSSPVSTSMLAASCVVAMTASPIATLACLTSFSTTDYRNVCEKITVPTLIIHGDQDQTVPIVPTSKAAAELMDAAELEIYAGAPHGLFYTHRDDLNRDIAAFASDGAVTLTTRE
jgi:non-heme chloroperoxidase